MLSDHYYSMTYCPYVMSFDTYYKLHIKKVTSGIQIVYPNQYKNAYMLSYKETPL